MYLILGIKNQVVTRVVLSLKMEAKTGNTQNLFFIRSSVF
jgi:hypothetical protein